jgi:S-formylglutathione hydrolase FrmB
MRSGFAAIAWPARYGDTGVMSFMISHAGVVYEKDLGPNTDAAARAMTRFNPDSSWRKSPVSQ